jgi:hypothetical protein
MHQYCTYTRILVKLHTVSSSVGTRRRKGRSDCLCQSRVCRRYSCTACGGVSGCSDDFDRRLACCNHRPE